jgi:hypothetical protein
VTKPTVNDDEVDPADLALFKEVGFEEGAAKLLLKKLKGVSAKPDKSADELRMDIEIDKLKVNPLYTELEDEDVQDAVKAYAKGHGIKAKTAYLELFGEKKFETNRADLTREIEQRILADAKKRDAYGGIDTRDNGVIDAKPKVKVSKDMADMARLLGKTPEEYLSWAGEVSMEKARKMIQAKKKKG